MFEALETTKSHSLWEEQPVLPGMLQSKGEAQAFKPLVLSEERYRGASRATAAKVL